MVERRERHGWAGGVVEGHYADNGRSILCTDVSLGLRMWLRAPNIFLECLNLALTSNSATVIRIPGIYSSEGFRRENLNWC